MRNGSYLPTNWKRNALFGDLFNDFDSLLSTLPELRLENERNLNKVGAVDIEETDKAFSVHVDVPGFSKDEIKIEVLGDHLTVRAEKKAEAEKSEKKYHLRERNFETFERSFQLGELADLEKITAQYDKGVLSLEIPKGETAKQRTITIS
jgi:HSP20 family protein